MIGVWNLPGTIPTLICYGPKILSPAGYNGASALRGLVKGAQVHAPVPTETEVKKIGDIYHVNGWNLLPLPLGVLSFRKVAAPLALMAAALFAGVLGAFLPPRPVVVASRLHSDRR